MKEKSTSDSLTKKKTACNKTPMRSLDSADQASLTLPELSNVVYKLQPIVKEGKLRCIQKIIRNIKKLKKTQGDEKKIEKARSKAERLLDEMYTMKALSLEQISQFALGNTDTYFRISNQKDVPLEIKAMTRVSDFPKVKQYVKTFREKHNDWENLCDFMLFKQTGRKHKKSIDPHLAEKVKASEALVKTYINKKFAGDEEKIKKAEKISSHILKKKKSQVKDSKETEAPEKNNDKNIEVPKKRKLFASLASLDEDEEVLANNKNVANSSLKLSKETEDVTEECDDAGSSDSDDGNDRNFKSEDSDSQSDEESSSEDEINHTVVQKLEKNNMSELKSNVVQKLEKSNVSKLKSSTQPKTKDEQNLSSDDDSDSSSDENSVEKNNVLSKSSLGAKSKMLKNSKVKKKKELQELSESDSDSSLNDEILNKKPKKVNKDKKMKVSSEESDSDESSTDSFVNKKTKNINSDKKLKASSKSLITTGQVSKGKGRMENKGKGSGDSDNNGDDMDSGNESDGGFMIKRNRDMVVQKIDWNEFGDKDINNQPLIFNGGRDSTKTANPKSDFFLGGEIRVQGSAKGNKTKFESESDDGNSEDEAEYTRGYGKALIESSFLPSLGSSYHRQRPVFERKERVPPENKRDANSKLAVKETERNKKTKDKKGSMMSKTTSKQAPQITENVHPSWAASMKRKQEQAMISAFKGKKIKFD